MNERKASGADRGERSEYYKPFVWPPAPRSVVHEALLALTDYRPVHGLDGKRDGRRKAMIDALDGHATWGAIRGYVRGRRQLPQWARDLIHRKLAERMAQGSHVLELLKQKAGG